MRRTTANRGAQAALLAAIVALAVAGCGGTSTDKAGGAQKPKPTVLTMANGNGRHRRAGAVRRRSSASVRRDAADRVQERLARRARPAMRPA